jgi:small-conductance mechanosensitive channel/ribosomal protein L31E
MSKKIISSLCLVMSIMSFMGVNNAFARLETQDQETREVGIEQAPVMIDDFLVFHLRGIRAYPAKERAREIARRIRRIAANRQIKTEDIVVVETELMSDIVVGKERIIALFDTDASLEQVDREVLAQTYALRIKEAITRYRKSRDSDRILRAAVYSALWTAAVIGILFLLNFLYKKLSSWLESRYKKKIHTLKIQSLNIVRAERIWMILTGLMRTIRIILILLIIYLYLSLVLNSLPWTRYFGQRLSGYILSPIQKIGQAILDYIPNFIFIVVFIIIIRYLLKLIRLFFAGLEKETITFHNFDPTWARPTYKLIRGLVIILSVVILYPYVPGADSAAFKGVSIFIGIIVSLGSSTAISNIISGYTMIYRRTFRIGDRIKIEDLFGDVTEMRLLVTHLKSLKNEEIVVPNSLILSSSVINYSSISREKGLVLHTNVSIGYDAPWRQVEALLLKAAEKTPGVLKEPKPFVLQKSLDDFYVSYELNAYIATPQAMVQTYSELHRNILDAFNEAGVQIMSPHYEADPSGVKVVPKEKWYAPPAKKAKK